MILQKLNLIISIIFIVYIPACRASEARSFSATTSSSANSMIQGSATIIGSESRRTTNQEQQGLFQSLNSWWSWLFADTVGLPKKTKIVAQQCQTNYRKLSPQELFEKGKKYHLGDGEEINLKLAAHLYQLAADRDHPGAQFFLGLAYENGIVFQQDLKKAFEYFQLSAAQGCGSLPLCLLSIYYENGIVVEKDQARADELYQLALKQPMGNEEWILGKDYEDGTLVKKDLKKAIKLFQLASVHHSAPALVSLGWCYEEGIGVEKNEKKAFELYQLSAQQEYAHAQWALGACYKDGIGTEKDIKKAIALFESAAKQGHPKAQRSLGLYYSTGIDVIKDEKKACELYKLAALQGDSLAQLFLGINYENGLGVEKDEKQAFELYQRAAQQKLARAQCCLGYCYRDGTGIEKNYETSFEYFLLAAQQNYTPAQAEAGICYILGRGVNQNPQKAFQLLQIAADKGDLEARLNLGECYVQGIGVEVDVKKSFELYQFVSQQNNPDIQISICKSWQKRLLPQQSANFKQLNDYCFQQLIEQRKSVKPQQQKADWEKAVRDQINARELLVFEGINIDCAGDSCPICFKKYKAGEPIAVLPCCHIFCPECIMGWFDTNRNSCPTCRQPAQKIFSGKVMAMIAAPQTDSEEHKA